MGSNWKFHTLFLGGVSWYNHFGKLFGIIYESQIDAYPVTTNSFATLSQQNFTHISLRNVCKCS